jgi:hypothetical protein
MVSRPSSNISEDLISATISTRCELQLHMLMQARRLEITLASSSTLLIHIVNGPSVAGNNKN